MSSSSLRYSRVLGALFILGSALALAPGRTSSAFVCTPPIFQGWVNSCQGLQLWWLNKIPSYQIDHYDIYYETRYDGPATSAKLATLPGSATKYSDLSGCGLYAHYIIRQFNKDGSVCETRTSQSSKGVPHSFPCDSRCLGGASIGLNQAAPPTVAAGADITYTITANNFGPNPIQNILLTDTLPGATTFVSCAATGAGVCGGSGNSRTVTFAAINPGVTETVTLVAKVDPGVANGTVITNTVTAAPSSSGPVAASTTVTNTPSCTTTISPGGQPFPASGGGGSVNVVNNCGWSAASATPWITINSGASGSGSGTITYTVAANPDTSPRQGAINVSGRTFNVTQSGASGGSTPPSITTSALPGGKVGVAYSQSLNATGGAPPYNWFFTFIGALPPGLSLNADGTISGTPTAAGTYAFTAGVSDSSSLTAQKALSMTITNVPVPPVRQVSTAGVYRPLDGRLYLRFTNTSGYADVAIPYGMPGDYPVTGDWDGDGVDTIGIYRGGAFFLRNSNTAGYAEVMLSFGQNGDLPVAGDWDGDGKATVGVFRGGQFLLRNSLTAGPPDWAFSFGLAGDLPVTGDWDGDGVDTVGVYRSATATFFLRNANNAGAADLAVNYGAPGDLPMAGDWDGDGVATVGIYRQGLVALRNSNTGGYAELAFLLGTAGDVPLAGRWQP